MEASRFLLNSVSNFHILSTQSIAAPPPARFRPTSTSRLRICFCLNPQKKKFSKNDSFVAPAESIEDDNDELEENEDNTPQNGKVSSSTADWEAEFLGVVDSHGDLPPDNRRKQPKSRLLRETDEMEWCVRARKVALKSIDARGLKAKMESMVINNSKKKKKKKKKRQPDKVNKLNSTNCSDKEDDDEDDLDFLDADFDVDSSNKNSDLRRSVSMISDGMFVQRKEKSMETLVQRLSQFSGPSDRRKEINLNKAIVEAHTAEEVLEVTADIITAVAKGLHPSPLSPLNIATALHRIARSMESMSMVTTRRLAFARQREMCMLVGMAMAALPDCSGQGVSNIAWALSKIGGDLLYMSEMDRVAEVALTKVAEFNSQNVANLAGAYASMRHSAPQLFSELSKRASDIIDTFQPQEISQVLWAFASLYEPADPLLEALDGAFKDVKQLKGCSANKTTRLNDDTRAESIASLESTTLLDDVTPAFARDQLGCICWSYAVLGQLNRPFFFHVWGALKNFMEQEISEQYREDVVLCSEVQLVNRCLKLEYTHLEMHLSDEVEGKITRAGRTKKFNQKVTSSFQKQVYRLLLSTGLDWVMEYNMEGYTLDAALIYQKVALEIDGPTHFSRNSGVPLGHTMLKRRCISAGGWKLVPVSHSEWEGGEYEQLEYLRTVINDHIHTLVKDEVETML